MTIAVLHHGLRVYQRSPFFYVSAPPFIPALHLQTFRLVTRIVNTLPAVC
jgi:hypothetical protein